MNEEHWFKSHWRPAMAWKYAFVTLFDFVLAPSICMALKLPAWEPLTLKESGFYHMAMMSIIGVSAFTRGQEKIKRLEVKSEAEEK